MKADEIRKQWHGPFCSAMKLELGENREDIDFRKEYNLSSKPLQIDLLIIKKSEGIIIDNEIGKIFCGHNILEYKSPGDSLNIDTYFKVLGYACLYKAGAETVDAIKEEDITLSFVREEYPRELVKYFQTHGYVVEQRFQGIYYVTGGIFRFQVIVSGKLDPERHLWLTSLTRNMEKTQAENLVFRMSGLSLKADRQDADSILELAMKANPKMFSKVKEENPMCEALMELMKPEMDAAVEKAVEKAIEEATDTVQTQAVDTIIKKYGESLENACRAIGISLERYWKIKHADQQKAADPSK